MATGSGRHWLNFESARSRCTSKFVDYDVTTYTFRWYVRMHSTPKLTNFYYSSVALLDRVQHASCSDSVKAVKQQKEALRSGGEVGHRPGGTLAPPGCRLPPLPLRVELIFTDPPYGGLMNSDLVCESISTTSPKFANSKTVPQNWCQCERWARGPCARMRPGPGRGL